jgi:tripartite-type tricarboxylate transporter receptor subunit TctC
MKFPRRKFLHLAAGAAALPVVSRIAWGQTYPTRTVTLIVPFAAGGATDAAARVAAEHMSRILGQQIIVENVAGAGGTTGSLRAKRASPDGYTILMGHMGTHAVAVSLYPNLAYRPETDFEPIGVVVEFPLLIAARRDFPAKDLKEFVTYSKANGDKLNMAHGGVGSNAFNFGLVLNSIIGIKPTLVPFAGTGPATSAMMGGQVDYLVTGVPEVGQQIVAGCSRATRSVPPNGARRYQTFRPRGKRGCQSSRRYLGLPFLRRKAHRDRSWTRYQTLSTKHWTTRMCASDWSNSAATFPAKPSAASSRSRPLYRARLPVGRRSSRLRTLNWNEIAAIRTFYHRRSDRTHMSLVGQDRQNSKWV